MKEDGFVKTMFKPLAMMAFALACALGASVGGYNEQYVLFVAYAITLAVAIWQTYLHWKRIYK